MYRSRHKYKEPLAIRYKGYLYELEMSRHLHIWKTGNQLKDLSKNYSSILYTKEKSFIMFDNYVEDCRKRKERKMLIK